MAIQSVVQLKAWFRTGLKPLQQQFFDWIDSYRHVSVAIQMADLAPALQAAINAIGATSDVLLPAGTAAYTVPAGTLLEKLLFLDAANPVISVGKTAGTADVFEAVQMAGGALVLNGPVFFATLTNLYFTGITGNTVVKVYKDSYAGNVVNLSNGITLAPGAVTYNVPAGSLITKILLVDAANPLVSVGSAAGATDVYQPVQMANGYTTLNGDNYFANAQTIYFNGVTADTIIKIFTA